jgi:hypothetical protein
MRPNTRAQVSHLGRISLDTVEVVTQCGIKQTMNPNAGRERI